MINKYVTIEKNTYTHIKYQPYIPVAPPQLQVNNNPINTTSTNLFCIYNKPEHGNYIYCDECNEWYHPKCMGERKNFKDLKKLKKWYCVTCKYLFKKKKKA